MPTTTAAFRYWLKSNSNIKLSSDASVLRITHEGITNYESLLDFDKNSIQLLPSICKEKINAIPADDANGISDEPEVSGANISAISVQRLIVASYAASYYKSISRSMTAANMHYANILANFKQEWQAYKDLRDLDEPKVPKIRDQDGDRKIIRWAPIFRDAMSRTYGSKGPLSYFLRNAQDVPTELNDPLVSNDSGIIISYYGESGSLLEELIKISMHCRCLLPLFQDRLNLQLETTL